MELPELIVIVKVLGTLACVVGMLFCLRVAMFRARDLEGARPITLGLFGLSSLAAYKIMAFGGLLMAPAAGVALANFHTFEGTRETESCLRCHVMRPMGNDMHDPASETLAAVHYRNKYIPDNQCYHCHVDYGLSGTLEAKTDGFRHLARYTTRTFQEPIVARRPYHNQNCLNCHGGTPAFAAVKSHATVGSLLATTAMSCLNCHGKAHPSRAERTPGSTDYPRLMQEVLKP